MTPLLLLALLSAQSPGCAPRAEMLAALASRYGEMPEGAGLSGPIVMEILAAPDGATWSLLITRPDGLSCIVAAGQAWRDLAPPPAGDPS